MIRGWTSIFHLPPLSIAVVCTVLMTTLGLAVAILTSSDPIEPTTILAPGNSALISSVVAPLTTKPTVSKNGCSLLTAANKSLLCGATVAAAVAKHAPHCSFHSKLAFLLLLLSVAEPFTLVVVVLVLAEAEAEAEAEASGGEGGGEQGTQGPTF